MLLEFDEDLGPIKECLLLILLQLKVLLEGLQGRGEVIDLFVANSQQQK